jgi:tRNA pseudouridine55 synthase
LQGFLGGISQRPPAYSAVKVGGRRAYALARAGEAVELASRDVTIHELTVVSWDDTDPERPVAVLDVVCSAGTYIRALARDLGEVLGSAAYLGALTRTASGPFLLGDATPLDDIRSAAAAAPAGLAPYLRPIDAGLEAFRGQADRPRSRPSRRAVRASAAGVPAVADHYRLRAPDGAIVGIASAAGDVLRPTRRSWRHAGRAWCRRRRLG